MNETLDSRLRELYRARHRCLDAEDAGQPWARGQRRQLEREIDYWETKEFAPAHAAHRDELRTTRRLVKQVERLLSLIGTQVNPDPSHPPPR